MKHTIPFGSRVYGLTNEESDYDYVEITDNVLFCSIDPNIECYSFEMFKEKLEAHDIKAIELYFTAKEFFNDHGIYFKLDKKRLRHSVSAVVSNAYVKAKKKILQGDVYIGVKSYYHCIRILRYANSLVENNNLDFKQEKEYLRPIYNDIVINRKNKEGNSETFSDLDSAYKTTLQELRHDFKMLCPK